MAVLSNPRGEMFMERIMVTSSHYFLMALVSVWWFLTLLVLGAFCHTNGGSGCIATEREALLQFKLGLQDLQGNLRTWTSTINDKEDDCCRGWSGVRCDNQTGHVVELNLGGMNLGVRGCENLHQSTLCHLTRLQHLDFSSNNFYKCSIPSFLGCFMELKYLNLSNSYFQGVVPSSLGNLSKLVQLDLSKNASDPILKIHDARWFRRLHSLEYIDMSHSQLKNSSSHWIQSLSELPSLSTLICSHCDIIAFPKSQLMFRFTTLQTLDLSYCFLGGHVPVFIESMQSLQELHISYNDFIGSISIFFENLKLLQKLDLSFNYFNGSIPASIGNLSLLQDLNLSNNILSGLIPTSIGNLLLLQKLDLSWNNFNGLIPISIGNLSLLQKLDLSWNNFNGLIPISIRNLSSLQSLDLSHNKLNGSIPPFLKKLSSLQSLNLSSNEFNEFILPFFGNLSLRKLHLSNMSLNGSIPSFIRNLPLLQTLDLSRNNFVGFIPIFLGNLTSLQSLDLSHNKLNGSIPTSLGNLASLQYLDISYNKLNGSIPKSLCNLSLLNHLYLYENDNIDGVDFPKCFRGLSKLQELYLEGHDFNLSESHFINMSQLNTLYLKSNLSSTFHISSFNWIPPFSLLSLSIQSWRVEPNELFPTWIRTQNKLGRLILSNVGITGSLPTWIWNFSSSLHVLDMSSNDMNGEIPDSTNYNNKLQIIDLSSNKFEGSKWLSSISNMTSTLHYLLLSNNTNLFGSIPSLLCEVQYLRILDLSKNQFSGEIPDCMMKVTDVLHLDSNRFNSTFPMISEHQNCTLKTLHLENNQLHGNLPRSLDKCGHLVVLDLGENKFTGSIPSWTHMQSLKILGLRSNRLYGNVPQSLSRLESLQVLDLGNNNLSGFIPKTIGDFKAMMIVNKLEESIVFDSYYYKEAVIVRMKGAAYDYVDKMISLVKSIDLSNNNLSGVIPHEFGNLHDLLNLNLSRNHLTSTIPKTLTRLLRLETLDLSRNELSGQIPQAMMKMTALSHLNMSGNNLSGRIPTSNQFSTFDNKSYIDNPNLCGPPLSKSCKEEQNPKSKSDQNEDDDDKEKLWLYMTAVFGFIVGFWTFYGILFFKKTWRYPYLQFLSNTSEVLYMKIIQPIKWMVK